MQILLAIDSFKGCLSSEEVEAAFSQALTARGAEVRSRVEAVGRCTVLVADGIIGGCLIGHCVREGYRGMDKETVQRVKSSGYPV